jgi:hypothetical protein
MFGVRISECLQTEILIHKAFGMKHLSEDCFSTCVMKDNDVYVIVVKKKG